MLCLIYYNNMFNNQMLEFIKFIKCGSNSIYFNKEKMVVIYKNLII